MNKLIPNEVIFERDPAGHLNCRLADGTLHEQVHCVSLFPLSMPEQFVSVVKEVEQEFEEIGVLAGLDKFSAEQRQIIRMAISERYFVPEILDIKRLDRRHGIFEWEVITDRGEKIFYQINPKESMTFNNVGVLLVSDIEKCRFKISNLEKLPQRAKGLIELVLL